MVLPKTDDTSLLKEIDNYPLYIQPKIKGVEIMIRSGKAHMIDSPYTIYNLDFRQTFVELIRNSLKHKCTLHCVLYSNILDNEEIVRILHSRNPKEHLPLDATVYLTDLLFEYHLFTLPYKSMYYEDRINILKSLGYDSLRHKEQIEFFYPMLVNDYNELVNAINLVISNVTNVNSIIISEPKSVYIQGTTDILKTTQIELLLYKTLTGKLIGFTYKYIRYNNKLKACVIEAIIKYNNEKIIVPFKNHSREQRIAIYKNKDYFINKDVQFEAVLLNNVPCKSRFLQII